MSKNVIAESSSVEITVLVDNFTDALQIFDDDVAIRPKIPMEKTFLAEHGLSLLLRVCSGDVSETVLMDCGASGHCLLHNAGLLHLDLDDDVDSVFISHGHHDHFGGLPRLLSSFKRHRRIVIHPEAFHKRRINAPLLPSVMALPQLNVKHIQEAGAGLSITRKPYSSPCKMILSSGEVKRTSRFEKGSPYTEICDDGQWQVDTFKDDQGLAVNLAGKGLVIVTGCAHSGVINTIRHFQRITGIEKIHAVLGGFHLSGPPNDALVDLTVRELKRLTPEYVIPMHCTGTKAAGLIAGEMPRQYRLSTVGTRFAFRE